MELLSLLTLIVLPAIVFGTDDITPSSLCDCFDIRLNNGFPKAGSGETCYEYKVNKKASTNQCPQSLEFFIITTYESVYKCI